MDARKIVMASDHAGLELKLGLKAFLEKEGCTVEDVGTHSAESCDYPDYAEAAGRRIAAGEFEFGVFVCGTGSGIAIAANKVRGIRAVACTHELLARMSRLHNNANVVCLGQRVVAYGLAESIVKSFLESDFEGGRHARRVDKITKMEA